MRILLTNDDGVSAAGLLALKNALLGLGEIIVVAPADEQSGTSLALTYLEPIHTAPVRLSDGYDAHQVAGKPVDCVKFALLEHLEQPPDIVVSGLNIGPNTGVNVFYSGTVAAALEASLAGVPSVAFSTVFGDSEHVEWAAGQARRVLEMLMEHHDGVAKTFNVNIPQMDKKPPRCVFTHQATRPFNERYRPAGKEGSTSAYHLETAENEVDELDSATDVGALLEGHISITPLAANLTDSDCLRRIRSSESVMA